MKKTVKVNGQNIKVEFSAKMQSIERFGDAANYSAKGDYIFTIDGTQTTVQFETKTTRDKFGGHRRNTNFIYNGQRFPDNHKAVIEAILSGR